jgi:hypothetical protein
LYQISDKMGGGVLGFGAGGLGIESVVFLVGMRFWCC